jgi:hypothetical protein
MNGSTVMTLNAAQANAREPNPARIPRWGWWFLVTRLEFTTEAFPSEDKTARLGNSAHCKESLRARQPPATMQHRLDV